MKKKAVTLLLSLTFALGVWGCGSAEATNVDVPQKQEAQKQEQEVKQEQEQTQEQQEVEQEPTTEQEEFKEIGGLTPTNANEKEKLQKFLDDDNYYTYGEFWTKVKEIIAEKEKVAVEYDYTDKTAPHEVTENKDEFERIGIYAPYLTKENCDSDNAISDTAEILWRLEEYYIEVTVISDEYVEWELWGKTKEEYKN